MGAWFDSLSPEDRAAVAAEMKVAAEIAEASKVENLIERIGDVIRGLKALPAAREYSLAITKLEEGILWINRKKEVDSNERQ